MRYAFAILMVCFLNVFANGQVVFQKMFASGGWAKANNIQIINSNNYIISGSSSGAPYIIKINRYGDTLITKTMNITSDKSKIIIGNGNNYFIAGHTADFGAGNSDIYVLKTDTNFNLQWVKSYGGGGVDLMSQVQLTSDSGLLITGNTSSYGAGFSDAYIIKTDKNGDSIWTKTYGTPESEGAGGSVETTKNRFLIMGLPLFMINSEGDTNWTKLYMLGANIMGFGLVYKQSINDYFMVGGVMISGTQQVVAVMNIDTMGVVIAWSKTYTFPNNCSTSINAAEKTQDGGIIIAGNYCAGGITSGNAWLMRIDSSGSVLWLRMYSISDNLRTRFYDVKQTPDGGFIAVGETGGFFTSDVYVVKTDANGNSGCGDSTVSIVVTDVIPTVSTPPTQVGSGGIVGNYTVSVSGTNTTDSTLCFDTIVGINENIETGRQPAQMQVFPNPFSHAATITFDLPGILDAVLSINDISGRTVATYKLSPPYREVEITSSGLENGIYFARIVSENRTLAATKIIVLK